MDQPSYMREMYGTIRMSEQEPLLKATKCLCLFCIYRPNHAIIAGQFMPQRNVSLLLCVGISKMLMLHKLAKREFLFNNIMFKFQQALC